MKSKYKHKAKQSKANQTERNQANIHRRNHHHSCNGRGILKQEVEN